MGDVPDFDRTDRPSTAQPPPKRRPLLPSMHALVAQDFLDRGAYGERKYGTKLTALNGRDPLKDLYEELLDAVVYCRQMIEEREMARARSVPAHTEPTEVLEVGTCGNASAHS